MSDLSDSIQFHMRSKSRLQKMYVDAVLQENPNARILLLGVDGIQTVVTSENNTELNEIKDNLKLLK